MKKAKIKICGLYREEDILYVNEAKPDYCGFIINFPKSHRTISKERAREFAQKIDKEIIRVGVIVNQSEEFASELLNEGIVDIVQLHGNEDNVYVQRLREMLHPEICEGERIWKAIKIRKSEDMDIVNQSIADMVVLDNGYGTGNVFDWNLIHTDREFMLAGGLTPENIPEAIASIHPFGIDISSGVETDKRKDKDKIMAAVHACHR